MSAAEPRATAVHALEGTEDHSSTETVILGGSDETRLLLRGLLKLQRYHVVGEARNAELLPPDESPHPRRVLLLVSEEDHEEWTQELATARSRQPGLLPLLVAPDPSEPLRRRARAMGVRGILPRPFAIRHLVRAVDTVARGGESFAPLD